LVSHRAELVCHPDARPDGEYRVEVRVARVDGTKLSLRYSVRGDLDALRIPPAAPPARRDLLWKHTCFEAFVRVAGERAYQEFNFSPSREWAAYRFSSYRQAAPAVDEPSAEEINSFDL
jgi:hypothetical protein